MLRRWRRYSTARFCARGLWPGTLRVRLALRHSTAGKLTVALRMRGFAGSRLRAHRLRLRPGRLRVRLLRRCTARRLPVALRTRGFAGSHLRTHWLPILLWRPVGLRIHRLGLMFLRARRPQERLICGELVCAGLGWWPLLRLVSDAGRAAAGRLRTGCGAGRTPVCAAPAA